MQPEINQEAIARMLDQVQKPTRYTGGEMNTQLKPWDSAKLHFASAFRIPMRSACPIWA